ncbi:MAG: fibro-slime domain-containing protein [Planctomycetota bacterium]|nr:fibro-slime domain-containing protein [Planctomycetota bacterium]
MVVRQHLANATLTAGIVAAAGLLGSAYAPDSVASAQTQDQYAELPAEITLTGVVRDFKERSVTGGHPDFERQPTGGFGHYMGNIAPQLDSDKKPVFAGGGKKVSSQWRTSGNKNIHPSTFKRDAGDTAGSYSGSADSGAISSAASFAQWYRDVPGVNMSRDLSITLRRQPNSPMYVFDDRSDPLYSARGGFFPVNNELFGNSRNESKNFHFTFELATEFIYKPGTNQTFTFIGDDDVWVFINDQLVIDLGGVHSAINQTVFLDRLANLVPNGTNTLRVFHAERHRTQSNFRIETTINLKNAELPTTANMYD